MIFGPPPQRWCSLFTFPWGLYFARYRSQTSLCLLGWLTLKSLGLDVMRTSDGHWEFVKIVTDGHIVNKVAVGILA